MVPDPVTAVLAVKERAALKMEALELMRSSPSVWSTPPAMVNVLPPCTSSTASGLVIASVATDGLMLQSTVYGSLSPRVTSNERPLGTAPVLQFAGVFHAPPAGLVQAAGWAAAWPARMASTAATVRLVCISLSLTSPRETGG